MGGVPRPPAGWAEARSRRSLGPCRPPHKNPPRPGPWPASSGAPAAPQPRPPPAPRRPGPEGAPAARDLRRVRGRSPTGLESPRPPRPPRRPGSSARRRPLRAPGQAPRAGPPWQRARPPPPRPAPPPRPRPRGAPPARCRSVTRAGGRRGDTCARVGVGVQAVLSLAGSGGRPDPRGRSRGLRLLGRLPAFGGSGGCTGRVRGTLRAADPVWGRG